MLERGAIVVVKFGSSTLVTTPGNTVNEANFASIVQSIEDLHQAGINVVIVSSGAVALGRRQLSALADKADITSKQVLATIGQHHLMALWSSAFAQVSTLCGQVLVTKAELSSRTANLNVRDTLQAMLNAGVVPIVNENDSVAVDEIRYGDNDSLAAQVALAIGAAGVVLWTDVPGMYTGNPRIDTAARLVESLSASELEQFRKYVGGAGTHLGTGGMLTKLDAASLAATGGIWTRIVGCAPLDALVAVIAGEYPSTLVTPTVALQDGRTRWILANPGDGRIICNVGAADWIIRKGASLLAVGVVDVAGTFVRGDIVRMYSGDVHIATGIARYDAYEVKQISGCREADIEQVLGYTAGPVVIHRDDLALL
jgi:glutamate 5-kinase